MGRKNQVDPWQEKKRGTLSNATFGRKVRSWFEAWLNNWLGNRHVARAIIRYGTTEVGVVARLLEAMAPERTQVAEEKKRKRQEKTHGAAVPVCKLKGFWTEKISRARLNSGKTKWQWRS